MTDSELDPNPSFAKAIAMMLEDVIGYADLPLRSFDGLFPDQAHEDRCYLSLLEGEPQELVGTYGVSDLYCQDPHCNCQKVSLVIFDEKGKIHATIAYGWKSKTFYRKWGLDATTIQSLTEGFLDPWAQQSPHAELFLETFFTIKRDPGFIARLKRRYTLFKETIAADPSLIIPYPDVELPENVIPLHAYKSLKK